MRQVMEASETRFDEASPFVDQAKFFASGTSSKWTGKLSDGDLARYQERCASLLTSEDAAWLNWGDRRQA